MERTGKLLREARESKDITLKEASQATKIGIRFLRALENDEYDVLPGHVYLHSFLKNYANFLGMDGEKFAEEFRPACVPSAPKSFSRPKRRVNEQTKKALLIFAVMLSVWLLWVMYQTIVVKF